MKFLVTGGSGYLGSEIVNFLLKQKHQVLNIDLNEYIIKDPNYRFKKIDVSKISELDNIVDNIDVVIHSVAKVPLVKNNLDFEKTNVLGTKNILNAALKKKIKKFIYVSSSAVYGISGKSPINEKSERYPCENYGFSKKRAEDLCFDFKEKGLNISIIRPRTVIGGKRLGIFSVLFWWIKNNKKIPVINNGKNVYQFVDINDLVESIYLVSTYEKNEDFNIGADEFFSIEENLNHLINKYNSKSKLRNISNNFIFKLALQVSKTNLIPLQEYHFKAYGENIYFDNSKAKRLLNWYPKYSNKKSFENSFNYYNESLNDLDRSSSPHQRIIKNFIIRFGTIFI